VPIIHRLFSSPKTPLAIGAGPQLADHRGLSWLIDEPQPT